MPFTRPGEASADSGGGPPTVFASKNGPYAVSGSVELQGATFGEGADPTRFTLCRCGFSKNKPFCDGAHWEHPFEEREPGVLVGSEVREPGRPATRLVRPPLARYPARDPTPGGHPCPSV